MIGASASVALSASRHANTGDPMTSREPPSPADEFQFTAGLYSVEIFGTIVGTKGIQRFWKVNLSLPESIHETGGGVFFNWRPSEGTYEARIDDAPAQMERANARRTGLRSHDLTPA